MILRWRFSLAICIFYVAYHGLSGPLIKNCKIFPDDNIWNAPIDALPIDPNSDSYINSIGASTGLKGDFGSGLWNGGPIGIPYTTVSSSSTTKYKVSFQYADESDNVDYPIPPNPPIEGGDNSTGDRHILIVDTDTCKLYELYSAYFKNGQWTAGSGAVFDLKSDTLRPETWTSADAAGLPMLPGLVRYDEIVEGSINHAIRFTAVKTRKAYVWPARHYASSYTDGSIPPMGQRFRLKNNFDVSSYPQTIQIILNAMKKYGIILADNGSNWYLSGVPDDRWDNDMLNTYLKKVIGSNLEAVDTSSLIISKDSGQANLV